MKKVSSRDFQLHAAKYLRELPIVLTSHNIPVAMVIPFVNRDMIHGKGDISIEMRGEPTKQMMKDVFKNEFSGAEEWPNVVNGKPLSGKKATCPICNEPDIPEEFAQKHYNDKHSDI